jgi:hypothetical protein
VNAWQWFRPRRGRNDPQPGLNTVADADAFVGELRAVALSPGTYRSRVRPAAPALTVTRTERPAAPAFEPFPASDLLLDTPIFDALVMDRQRRMRALRMPTTEMRAAFDLIAQRWLCSHCDDGDCGSCPGCSCPCKLAAVSV